MSLSPLMFDREAEPGVIPSEARDLYGSVKVPRFDRGDPFARRQSAAAFQARTGLVHRPVARASFSRAAADHAGDAVLGHEVEGAGRAALNRLPAFDRQALRPRHQRDLLQGVAAIGDLGRDRVEAPLVAEALLVEGLEDDVDAFLE